MMMSSGIENRKAAIIDDEQDLCLLLERILQREQFRTFSINTLQEIEEKVIPIHPDVIFLDNQLPDGSGICTIPSIRDRLPEVKIVVMTAFNIKNEKTQALQNGADTFLLKPLTLNIIEQTLDSLHFKHIA